MAQCGIPAVDALSDLATILSDRDEISNLLQQGAPWKERLGLSDSIFLIADDSVAAVRAAGELFYHLALLNASVPEQAVLLRGGIVRGQYEIMSPIFSESALKNLVGPGVVAAVKLEQSGMKGPRLLLDAETANDVKASDLSFALSSGQPSELLWPIIDTADGGDLAQLRPVFSGACQVIVPGLGGESYTHYVAYTDLIIASLERLQKHSPTVAIALAKSCGLARVEEALASLAERDLPPSWLTLRRLRSTIAQLGEP